jgi:UDP-glucose 4-epimerase
MKVLLTGGMGYLGTHTAIVLLEAGHKVVLYDNFSNSKATVHRRLETITQTTIPLIDGDVRDTALLEAVLHEYTINVVIHFAGLKAVGESVQKPIDYYDNNVSGTISLLKAMNSAGVKQLVFSSSATVYGQPQYLPLDENHATSATNPYGRTKLQIEEILSDVARADPGWSIACLRYFNPVGSHSSGLIGEDPNTIPSNLMPYMARVASGHLPYLNIFGDNYDTQDGTGVRDYIHVMDLAEGHRAALDFLNTQTGWHAINLGTGRGYSVFEMIQAFEIACGQTIPYQIVDRRPGDVSACYAQVEKAKTLLKWQASRSLEDMCASAWQFIRNQTLKQSPLLSHNQPLYSMEKVK